MLLPDVSRKDVCFCQNLWSHSSIPQNTEKSFWSLCSVFIWVNKKCSTTAENTQRAQFQDILFFLWVQVNLQFITAFLIGSGISAQKISLFHWIKVRDKLVMWHWRAYIAKMEEDEEVELLMSPISEDRIMALTSKELLHFLKKKGFPVDQCHILEGMFFWGFALAVNSVFQ